MRNNSCKYIIQNSTIGIHMYLCMNALEKADLFVSYKIFDTCIVISMTKSSDSVSEFKKIQNAILTETVMDLLYQ